MSAFSPVVVPELKFGNVQMQIFLADLMERPNDAALQDRPEAFDRIAYGPRRKRTMLPDGLIDD